MGELFSLISRREGTVEASPVMQYTFPLSVDRSVATALSTVGSILPMTSTGASSVLAVVAVFIVDSMVFVITTSNLL